jgi:hypothetical protein
MSEDKTIIDIYKLGLSGAMPRYYCASHLGFILLEGIQPKCLSEMPTEVSSLIKIGLTFIAELSFLH